MGQLLQLVKIIFTILAFMKTTVNSVFWDYDRFQENAMP